MNCVHVNFDIFLFFVSDNLLLQNSSKGNLYISTVIIFCDTKISIFLRNFSVLPKVTNIYIPLRHFTFLLALKYKKNSDNGRISIKHKKKEVL